MQRGFACRWGFICLMSLAFFWVGLHFGIQGLWGNSIGEVEVGIKSPSFLYILLNKLNIPKMSVSSSMYLSFAQRHGKGGV